MLLLRSNAQVRNARQLMHKHCDTACHTVLSQSAFVRLPSDRELNLQGDYMADLGHLDPLV